MNKSFIFTEGYNCGLILNKCLKSFRKYHPDTVVNVFGTSSDFKDIEEKNNINFINIENDELLKNDYKFGHRGTATLFYKVIKEYAKDYNYIIHFDSDVIFRKESLSLLLKQIERGYDLIGPRRCYKLNLNGRKDLSNLEDVVQTYFFAFNKTKISEYPYQILHQMIEGHYNPLGHAVLDFFDPISFDILKNGGLPFYLNYEEVGAQNELGDRINKYGKICSYLDFGDNLVHFAGIGSGMKFYTKGVEGANVGYADWAMKRYALYIKLFYNKKLDDRLTLEEDHYNYLKNIVWEF